MFTLKVAICTFTSNSYWADLVILSLFMISWNGVIFINSYKLEHLQLWIKHIKNYLNVLLFCMVNSLLFQSKNPLIYNA